MRSNWYGEKGGDSMHKTFLHAFQLQTIINAWKLFQKLFKVVNWQQQQGQKLQTKALSLIIGLMDIMWHQVGNAGKSSESRRVESQRWWQESSPRLNMDEHGDFQCQLICGNFCCCCCSFCSLLFALVAGFVIALHNEQSDNTNLLITRLLGHFTKPH